MFFVLHVSEKYCFILQYVFKQRTLDIGLIDVYSVCVSFKTKAKHCS